MQTEFKSIQYFYYNFLVLNVPILWLLIDQQSYT